MFYNINTVHMSEHVQSKIHNFLIRPEKFIDQKKTA